MFLKCLRLELYRAFNNIGFYAAMFIGCAAAVLHFVVEVVGKSGYVGSSMLMDYPVSVFNTALMYDVYSFFCPLYFYMIIILAALPHTISYYTDIHGGYMGSICVRSGRKNYMLSKYAAVFISSGTVMIVPLILNFALTMTVVPSIDPQPASMQFSMAGGEWMSELFYFHPYVYTAFYIAFDFVAVGLISCIALAVSRLMNNKYAVLLFPVALYFLLQAVTRFAGKAEYCTYFMLVPGFNTYITTFSVIAEMAGFLLLSAAGFFIVGGIKKDVL